MSFERLRDARHGITQLDLPFADGHGLKRAALESFRSLGSAPPAQLVNQLIASVEQLLKSIALEHSNLSEVGIGLFRVRTTIEEHRAWKRASKCLEIK